MKILPFFILGLLSFHLHAQETTTSPFFTKAYLEFERDIKIPIKIEELTNTLIIWKENLGPNWQTEWPQFQETIFRLEKDQKATFADLNDLKDTMLIVQKTEVETVFKNRVMGDKKLGKKYNNLWDRIKDLAEERSRHETRIQFHSTGGLVLLDAAVHIVRSCDPNETRENREQAIKILENYKSMSSYPISDNLFGRAFFVDHLTRAHHWLNDSDPLFTKVYCGRSGKEFLEAVYGGENSNKISSLVAFARKRDSIVSLGWNAIQESEDPAIVAARELVILTRENRMLGEELDKKERILRNELGNAFFEIYGIEGDVCF